MVWIILYLNGSQKFEATYNKTRADVFVFVCSVVCICMHVDSSFNMMAHSDVRWGGEGKLSNSMGRHYSSHYLETTVITTADVHTSAASSRLNWLPPTDVNGLVRLAAKTKCAFSERVPSHFRCSLLRPRFLYPLAGWSSGYCLDITWLLPGNCLLTEWLIPGY
jgi:hypothetical protein